MEKIYPLKFLKSYEKKDANLYFGREEEIAELYAMVRSSKITVVYGPSGTGKSSLIQCGLSREFKPHDWHDIYVRRGNNINDSFNNMLISEGGVEGISDVKQAFNNIYRESFRPIYLFFDQFEEIFILGTKAERDIFVATVKQILDLEQSVKMIFSIREEYLGYLAEFEKALPRFMSKKLRIAPMGLSQVEKIVIGISTSNPKNPDSLIGLEEKKEEIIASKIFDKVAGIEKTRVLQLPYLQVFMAKLYQEITHDPAQKTEAVFTEAAVDGMGDIGDILREFMEQQVTAVCAELVTTYPALTETDIWEILVRFISLDGTKEPKKIESLFGQVSNLNNALITDVVLQLSTRQILRDAGGIYELAHDALATKIVAHRSEEYAAVLRIEQIINSQVEIGKIGKNAVSFLPENQVNIADMYWAQLSHRLNDEAKQFVSKSKEYIKEQKEKEVAEQKRQAAAAEREKQKKRRRIVYSVSAALVAVSILLALKYKMDYEREQKRFLALCAGSALSQYKNNDITKSLRFASYAYEANPGSEAATVFYSVIFRNADKLDHSFYRRSLQHADKISSIAISGDNKRILTGSEDYTAKIWDKESGSIIATLEGHTDKVQHAEFSKDDKKILTASDDGTVKIWDGTTGKLQTTIVVYANKEDVGSACFSPDGTKVLTAARHDSTASLWDAGSGQRLAILTGHKGGIYSINFSHDGKHILTASKDHTAKMWGAQKGVLEQTFTGHRGEVHSAVFAPDDKTVFTASQDKTAKKWDITSGKALVTFTGHKYEVWATVFSPDGQRIVTTSDDNTARIWDIDTGIALKVLTAHNDEVMSAVFSPDGRKVLTSSLDFTAKVWDTSGIVLASLGHANALNNAVFAHDGSYMVTSSSDHTAKVWEVVDRTNRKQLSGNLAAINALSFSATGKEIMKEEEGPEKMMDSQARATIPLTSKDNFMAAVCLPGGKTMAAPSPDNTAKVWDLTSGKVVQTLTGHTNAVNTTACSPDGRLVVTASKDSTARIWDAASGKRMHTLSGHAAEIVSASFSPDGKWVLTASKDKTARIWDVASGECLHILKGHTSWVTGVTVSPDGKQVLTVSYDNIAKIWDAGNMKELATLFGHTSGVRTGAFSPDSKIILTTSLDHSAKMWDAATGKELATIADKKGVDRAFFSPDGKDILAIYGNNTMEMRHIYIPDIIKEMSNKTDDLTNDEKRNYGIPIAEGK